MHAAFGFKPALNSKGLRRKGGCNGVKGAASSQP